MSGVNTRTLLALAAVLALVPWPAPAGLRDCQPPEPARFLVFLNEPIFTRAAFAQREEMVRFFDRLQEHLDQRRDLDMAGIAGVPFRVARCLERVPAIDGGDFTPPVVRSLYTRGVVVEIWGSLDAERRNGRRAHPRAQINYLLVPVRKASDEGTANAPGFHRFHYPDGDIVATDFVDLVSNADLHAFVVTAIGVKAFNGEDYAQAHEMLCKASPQLDRIERRLAKTPATVAQSGNIQRLRAYVGQLAADAIREARKRPKVPVFAELLNPDNPCPIARVTP